MVVVGDVGCDDVVLVAVVADAAGPHLWERGISVLADRPSLLAVKLGLDLTSEALTEQCCLLK